MLRLSLLEPANTSSQHPWSCSLIVRSNRTLLHTMEYDERKITAQKAQTLAAKLGLRMITSLKVFK